MPHLHVSMLATPVRRNAVGQKTEERIELDADWGVYYPGPPYTRPPPPFSLQHVSVANLQLRVECVRWILP
jgi:hypothetical protein